MNAPTRRQRYDAVIVGGGHNGLVAASYLAQGGLSVLLLERLPRVGGAAISQQVFPGVPARLSAYSYLVSLFPDRIAADLGVEVTLKSRRTSSYSPVVREGRATGLLVERTPGEQTRASFRELTGSDREYDAWQRFYAEVAQFAQAVAPTMLEPLPARADLAARVPPSIWGSLVENPLGATIEERFSDDLVRGVVATDALIGTFTDVHDPGLEQNRCFAYHLIGNGTGEWRVPVGGMGALTASLERSAFNRGAEILTRAFVTRIDTDGTSAQVTYRHGDTEHVVDCGWVLSNVAPWVLRILLGEDPGPRPEGAQVKVNMVLDRLPRLRSGAAASTAFAGTFHVAEGYDQLRTAYRQAASGQLPDVPPGELYCHSLTDPTVMGALSVDGKHTLTYFGLHTPARLFSGHVEAQRDEHVIRMLDAINLHLEEPLESLLTLDERGNPCLQAKAPQDVETALAMPGGHIFHGPLSWPWADDPAASATPGQRWGVSTPLPNVVLCGAGAVRGGAVSGIGGHNAAMAVLESVRLGL